MAKSTIFAAKIRSKPPVLRTHARGRFRVNQAEAEWASIAAILREDPDTDEQVLAAVERVAADIAAVREELRRWGLRLCGLDNAVC